VADDKEDLAATFWQLHVLSKVAGADTWDEARDALGVSKYQITSVLDRLADRLDAELYVDDGRPTVVREDLAALADVILTEYRHFRAEALERDRKYWIRIDGYWSQIALAIGAAIAELESSSPVQVELASEYGRQRERGGAGLLSELRDGSVDLVVTPRQGRAPDKTGIAELERPTARGLEADPLYRAVLVAAVHSRHPLMKSGVVKARGARAGTVLVEDLQKYALATSPRGHWTREVLHRFERESLRFDFEVACPEPAALVALGLSDSRVPIVASDSVVPNWKDHWPALAFRVQEDKGRGAGIRVVHREYRVFWRTTGVPSELSEHLKSFADLIKAKAAHIARRADPWTGLFGPDGLPPDQ
jgi:hypothetical protein